MNSYQICYVDDAGAAGSEIVQAASLVDAWEVAKLKGSDAQAFIDTPLAPSSPLATGMAKLIALGLTPNEVLAIASGDTTPVV